MSWGEYKRKVEKFLPTAASHDGSGRTGQIIPSIHRYCAAGMHGFAFFQTHHKGVPSQLTAEQFRHFAGLRARNGRLNFTHEGLDWVAARQCRLLGFPVGVQ